MKKEKTVGFNLRMPQTLKQKVERQAKLEKRSLNKQIIHLLETFIAERSTNNFAKSA